MTGFPVLHHLLEFTQTDVYWVIMPSNHLILCHPLLLLPSIFPSIKIFSIKVMSKCPQEEIVIEKVQAWRNLVSPRVTRKTQKGQHLGSHGEVRSQKPFHNMHLYNPLWLQQKTEICFLEEVHKRASMDKEVNNSTHIQAHWAQKQGKHCRAVWESQHTTPFSILVPSSGAALEEKLITGDIDHRRHWLA